MACGFRIVGVGISMGMACGYRSIGVEGIGRLLEGSGNGYEI